MRNLYSFNRFFALLGHYLEIKHRFMKTTTLFLCILGTSLLHAQNLEALNGNNANASVTDNALFFNDAQNNNSGYEIPAGSNLSTMYAAAIWAGGKDVNGQVYVSASSYSFNGWASGPIANSQEYGSSNYTNQYGSSLWKVTRQQVEDHLAQYQQGGYVPAPEIADWPGNGDTSMGVAEQLAPFFDNDGDGVYEPLDGDHPDFPGDEVVYVIVNDEASPVSSHMIVEMHLMFYQFNDNGYLGETTFLNTRIFNRSIVNYYNYKQALYVDFDIGNYQDDYVGCDSLRNMMYAYNGDAFDENSGSAQGYEANPPCQAVVSLNRDLFATAYYANSSSFPMLDPTNEQGMWNYMNGLWIDGSPMFYGGNGYNSGVTGVPTHFLFTGNPYTGTGWSEVNANNGGPNLTGDRRAVMTTDIGSLPAKTSVCSDFAFIFDDDDGNLENVQNVQYIADALQLMYDTNGLSFPCGFFTANTPEIAPLDFNLFPNPSSGTFSLQFANNTNPVIVEVRDMTGRLLHSETTQAEMIPIQLDVPAGIYQVSVQSPHQHAVQSIAVQ